MIQNINIINIAFATGKENGLCHRKRKSNAIQGDHYIRKRHTGNSLYSDPMIQNIILPQMHLHHENKIKMPYRETTVYGNATQESRCIPTQWSKTLIMFWPNKMPQLIIIPVV